MRNLGKRISFSREFLLIGAVVVIAAMLVFGVWLGRQIENKVTTQSARLVATSVEIILAAQIQNHGWDGVGALPITMRDDLDQIFVSGVLKKDVAKFKLWGADHSIVYSVDHDQIGQAFPFDEQINHVFSGNRVSIIQPTGDNRHAPDASLQDGKPQMEVYVPIRAGTTFVVAEFDHPLNELESDIRSAKLEGWAMTGLCAIAIYALMYSRVASASNTIIRQHDALQAQTVELGRMLEENRNMQAQLRAAAASTTALNERFLSRIAADIHDGPVQDLAYVLLRFSDLEEVCDRCNSSRRAKGELVKIHTALNDSLTYLRKIAANMVVPGIETLSIAETVRKAIGDAEAQAEQHAETSIANIDEQAEPALKITLYRLLRESLINAWRHAKPAVPKVVLQRTKEAYIIDVSDDGPGFDPARAMTSGRLGLLYMRERVRLAGGTFEAISALNQGTRIRAIFPLNKA